MTIKQDIDRMLQSAVEQGANSFYWLDPSTGVAGVFATQLFPFADPATVDTYYAFETAVYRSLR